MYKVLLFKFRRHLCKEFMGLYGKFSLVFALIINDPGISVKSFLLHSWAVLYLNSLLNPVIYCWKMKHIGHKRVALKLLSSILLTL